MLLVNYTSYSFCEVLTRIWKNKILFPPLFCFVIRKSRLKTRVYTITNTINFHLDGHTSGFRPRYTVQKSTTQQPSFEWSHLKGYCHDNFAAFSSKLWWNYDPEPLFKTRNTSATTRGRYREILQGRANQNLFFLEIFPTQWQNIFMLIVVPI